MFSFHPTTNSAQLVSKKHNFHIHFFFKLITYISANMLYFPSFVFSELWFIKKQSNAVVKRIDFVALLSGFESQLWL